MKKRHHGNKELIWRREDGRRDLKGKIKRIFLDFFWQELESVTYIKILEDSHTSKAKWKNLEDNFGSKVKANIISKKRKNQSCKNLLSVSSSLCLQLSEKTEQIFFYRKSENMTRLGKS